MSGGRKQIQWNRDEIKYHLRSAVDSLTPDVLDRVDLNTPQDEAGTPPSRVISFQRRFRALGTVVAACLCLLIMAGGIATFQNQRIESVVGIDVNPSVELSVSRRNKVLKAEPLNEDAVAILDEMDLKNVDLNVAVNALIGSMVTHGYLDDLDNAILVTVSNDDEGKAADLRQTLVGDIEASLQENQVQAVVYDQQVVQDDEITDMAKTYGISYGKAYFLKELIVQNDGLSEEDMEKFASMTMEEIAKEIADGSYAVGKDGEQKFGDLTTEGTTRETTSGDMTTTAPETTAAEETTTVPETTHPVTTAPTTTPAETTTAAPTEETELDTGGKVKIDNVDFDSGALEVEFQSKVIWKNETVSVQDEDGVSYSARFTDTGQTSCSIQIDNVAGGKKYIFTIGGVAPKGTGRYTTAKGRFEAPDISEQATESVPETSEKETSEAETREPPESSVPDTSSGAPESSQTPPPSAEQTAPPQSVAAR